MGKKKKISLCILSIIWLYNAMLIVYPVLHAYALQDSGQWVQSLRGHWLYLMSCRNAEDRSRRWKDEKLSHPLMIPDNFWNQMYSCSPHMQSASLGYLWKHLRLQRISPLVYAPQSRVAFRCRLISPTSNQHRYSLETTTNDLQ